jgi:hypothetical protein
LQLTITGADTTYISNAICANDSVLFNGIYYHTAGNYTTTYNSSFGCDSVVILQLTVKPVFNTNVPETINCGDSVLFNGQYYHSTGTYSATFASGNGCDSVVNLQLTITGADTTYINDAICANDSVLFNGIYYHTAGDYTATYNSIFGCDSVVILELSVKPVFSTSMPETINCGDSVLFYGHYYHLTGTYSEILTAINGCDSIINLQLTLAGADTTYSSLTTCSNDSVLFNGQYYHTAGNYAAHYLSSLGCDSVVILELTVKPAYNNIVSTSISCGDSILFGASYYHLAGTYSETLTAQNGCDSVVNLNLSIIGADTTNLPVTICSSDSVLFNNVYYHTAGNYPVQYTSSYGCDSIVILELSVKPAYNNNISKSITCGDSILFGAKYYHLAGTYSATFTAQDGCDSVVNLQLGLVGADTTYLPITICSNDSVLFNGVYYKTAGVYTASYTGIYNCDSISILQLNVKPAYTTNTSNTITCGDSVYFGGHYYHLSGQYSATLTAQNGCDSVVNLDLTVTGGDTTVLHDTICSNGSFFFNGGYYNVAGTYTAHLTSGFNCDSTVFLHLAVNQVSASSTAATITCGDSIRFGNKYYYLQGAYNDTLTNARGCDSIVTLNLSVNSDTTYMRDTICAGGTFSFNGSYYNTSGTYAARLNSVRGCDSTVILQLMVLPIATKAVFASVACGDSVEIGNKYYYLSGRYIDTLTGAFGCDSVVTLQLTVAPDTITTTGFICSGDSIYFHGIWIYTGGTYQTTLPGNQTCDTLAIINLTFVPPITATHIADTICAGDSLMFNGIYYTSAGNDTAHYTAVSGCDSAVVLTLVIRPAPVTVTSDIITCGQVANFGGHSYHLSGNYYDTLTTVNGCDSLIELQLTVTGGDTTYLTPVITCANNPLLFDGIYADTTGYYTAQYNSATNCDSSVIIYVTVLPVPRTQLPVSVICGQSANFHGNNYYNAGSYSDTMTAADGCDSIITLQLTVIPDTVYLTKTICANDSVYFNTGYLHTAGTYMAQYRTVHGCDSTSILNLTVNPLSSSDTTVIIVCGNSFTFNGTPYRHSGTYYDTLNNIHGCDSVATLNLLVTGGDTTNLSNYICAGDTLVFDSQLIIVGGTYTADYVGSSGCDSMVILQITDLLKPTVSFTLDSLVETGQIYVDTEFGTTTNIYEYVWCSYTDGFAMQLTGGSPPGGEYSGQGIINNILSPFVLEGQSVVADTITYSYLGPNNCTGTASQVLNVMYCVGIQTVSPANLFDLYPNPAGDYTMIAFDPGAIGSTLKLYDIAGRQVISTQLNSTPQSLSLANLPAGVYTVAFSIQGQMGVKLLVKTE